MKTFLVVQWVKDFKLPLLGEVGAQFPWGPQEIVSCDLEAGTLIR